MAIAYRLMRHHLSRNKLLAATFALCLLSSCATKPPIYLRKSDYPVLPVVAPSTRWQARAERHPELKEKLYWHNYGGPGNQGGVPVDEMDRLFYNHDLAYLQEFKMGVLRKADRDLVRGLKAIDPSTLDETGKVYRKRAIFFFASPFSRWLGKPYEILFRTRHGPMVIWIEEGK